MSSTVAPLAVTSNYIFYKLWNSFLTISLDSNLKTLTFIATVPNNNYFAIGFGPSMRNTDMILWQAQGTSSKTTDLWSTGYF
jgi:hypothetical protein